jgi:hypothetical protein
MIPRIYGNYIIAQWKGNTPGGHSCYKDMMGGGLISQQWLNEVQYFKDLGPLGARLLCAALKSLDGSQKLNALRVLREYGQDASDAVPQLTPMLDEKDDILREEVIGCLYYIGFKAKPALPKLQELRNSLSTDEEANKTTLLLLKMAIMEINGSDDHPIAVRQWSATPRDKSWIVRVASVTGINGWIVGMALTILFGGLSIWSFVSDRRYFRHLLEAKEKRDRP